MNSHLWKTIEVVNNTGIQTKLRGDYEHRYVASYCLETYPEAEHRFRCPLGNIPEMWLRELGISKGTRMYRPYRPECDAAIITGDELILIEGKIFRVVDGISKLILYRWLIPETPEFSDIKSLPIRAVLVTPKEPGWARSFAEAQNIGIEVYMPEWIEEYYQSQERYWTAEERFERLKRRETLKNLGFK